MFDFSTPSTPTATPAATPAADLLTARGIFRFGDERLLISQNLPIGVGGAPAFKFLQFKDFCAVAFNDKPLHPSSFGKGWDISRPLYVTPTDFCLLNRDMLIEDVDVDDARFRGAEARELGQAELDIEVLEDTDRDIDG